MQSIRFDAWRLIKQNSKQYAVSYWNNTTLIKHKSTRTNSHNHITQAVYLALIGAHQHGICIVVAAIFDFITEEEWGERGRLRVGGGKGAKQPTAGNKIVYTLSLNG